MAANGDDIATSDDEDGAAFTTPLSIGMRRLPSKYSLRRGQTRCLARCGTVRVRSSRADSREPAGEPGVNTLSFLVPVGTVSDISTYARFRFSQAGGLSPTGLAPDGEVEDYQVTLAGTAISGQVFEDVNGNGARDFLVAEPDIVFVIDVSNSAIITVNPPGSTPVGDVNNDGLSETILDDELAAFIALYTDLTARVDNGSLSPNATVSIVTFVQTATKLDWIPSRPVCRSLLQSRPIRTTIPFPTSSKSCGLSSRAWRRSPTTAAARSHRGDFCSLATPNGAGFMVFLSDGLHSFPSVTTITPELNTLRGIPPALTNHKLIAFGVGPNASVGSPQRIALRH